jgi:hypothetical protein
MYGSGRMINVGGGISVGGGGGVVKRKYPHTMYKGGIKRIARTKAEHDELERQGFTHTKPKSSK